MASTIRCPGFYVFTVMIIGSLNHTLTFFVVLGIPCDFLGAVNQSTQNMDGDHMTLVHGQIIIDSGTSE